MSEYEWLDLGTLNGKKIAISFTPAGTLRQYFDTGDPDDEGATEPLEADEYTLWVDDDGRDIDQAVYELLKTTYQP